MVDANVVVGGGRGVSVDANDVVVVGEGSGAVIVPLSVGDVVVLAPLNT